MMIRRGFKALALGALLAVGAFGSAQAGRSSHQGGGSSNSTHGFGHFASVSHRSYDGVGHVGGRRNASRFVRSGRYFGESRTRYAGHSGGIQCVTFARADSGIELSGNANTWWNHAEGVYERGSRPEPGSVLNFRANGAMHMGHVAVVNQVVDSRTVAIDHANWGGPGAVRGGISRDITVVDVSQNNDWSAVRVGLGHSGDYGSVYPTFGFIYNRPDRGVMVATNSHGPVPIMNPAPRDLRGFGRITPSYDEVAEAPDVADPAPRFGSHRSRHHVHLVSTHSRRSRYSRY